MKKGLIIAGWLLSVNALAAPFVVSDPTTQIVTHCGLYLDAASPVDVPVVKTATGANCKFDINSVSTGVHTVKATFINIDPTWGRSESVTSAPFTFIRPASTMANSPTGLAISP